MTYMLLLVPLVAVVAVVVRPYDRCHVTCARATTATLVAAKASDR